MIKRSVIKELLELAETSEQADGVLEKYAELHETAQKLIFLRGMFDIELMPPRDGENLTEEEKLKNNYYAYLATIIDLKWR